MTSKEINQSIESMKIKLTKGEMIEHWVNFFFMLIPLILLGFLVTSEQSLELNYPTFGLAIVIAFLLLRHKIIGPKLNVYKSELTEEQFRQANEAAATLNEWVVLSNRNDYFSAVRETTWQWDGLRITAILDNGKIYLNSMVRPSMRSNPFTFGLNRRNRFSLIRQYQLILEGIDVIESAKKEVERREVKEGEESELTPKNIGKRIIGYSFSIAFIIWGIWMITTGELKTMGIGIFLVGLCSKYIYNEIRVILEK